VAAQAIDLRRPLRPARPVAEAHATLRAAVPELVRRTRPEVVICDIGLPDIDGCEVARTLRADEDLRSACLVALSGYAQPEDKQRAQEAGFDSHLSKPGSLDELNELLAQLNEIRARPRCPGPRPR